MAALKIISDHTVNGAHTESWILEKAVKYNLPSNFPDLENVWKIEIKSWKIDEISQK